MTASSNTNIKYVSSPNGPRLHEGESALHEEDDDGHDEQEEVVDLLRLRTVVLHELDSSWERNIALWNIF